RFRGAEQRTQRSGDQSDQGRTGAGRHVEEGGPTRRRLSSRDRHRIDQARYLEVLAASLRQLLGAVQQRESDEERAVKYRKLGKNGPTVSAIGLGAGSATTNFGERDDEVQIATVHRAIELGVTLFDTADRYMKGRHERMLGRALKGRRNNVIVCSKFGNIDNANGTKAYNGRPEYVRSACEASLAQLGVDHIDLYYLHRIDPEVPIEETVGAMSRLVESGKVRYLGLSEAGPKSLKRASAIHPITALQTEYSLWARDVEDEILPACRELGIGFVAYSPLGRGLLTGNIKKIDDIAAHDIRRKQPRFRPGNFE